ncbi:MAG: DUF4442 domain-containing protein [Syntrophomonadaceae bacterium]|jgi:hypothetical protein|nr:DUF4442 domain-containing protein [Syntrophomonadaceae bacterium]
MFIEPTELPFNVLIGLRYSDNADYMFMLEDKNQYQNHVGTVHASAQFALAEATSGHYLKQEFFSELPDLIPLLKKVEVRYRKPAKGKLFSKAALKDVNKQEVIASINEKGNALASVETFLFDKDANMVMQSLYEWYVILQTE